MLEGKGLLTPLQRAFLDVFVKIPDQEQFYMTGGTALAEYYLGHRQSFDLALFTSVESLIIPVSHQVEKACALQEFQLSVTRRFASYVDFLVTHGEEQVRVDLALDSPFRFADPVLVAPGIHVSSFPDIRIDKLLAYYGRAEPRDAVDLFFIFKNDHPRTLMRQAAEKDPGFDRYWFAVALNQVEDFPDEILRWPVKMITPFDPGEIKTLFKQPALEIMREIEDGG